MNSPLTRQLAEALIASGFEVEPKQILRSGPGYALVATQAAVRDLPPYYFIPADQWAEPDPAIRRTKLDQIWQRCDEEENARIFEIGPAKKALSIDEVLFNLLNLRQARKSYRETLVQDVATIVPSKLNAEGKRVDPEHVLGEVGEPSLWIVVAPGGWGKTSFCRKLALDLAKQTAPDKLGSASFPILVEFTREVEALPFEDLLARFCRQHQLDANRSGGLGYLLKTGRAVLIVDGFDELASTFGLEKARVALERVLSDACADAGRAIVSSRTQFYELVSGGVILGERLAGHVEERHASLETPDTLAVVRAHLGGRKLDEDEKEELDRHFGRLPRELGSSPLAAAWTAAEMKRDGLSALEMSQTAVQFYEWFVRRVCEREERKRLARIITEAGEQRLDTDSQLAWLELLAVEMLEGGGYEIAARSSAHLAELLATLLDDAVPHLKIEKGQEELTSHALLNSAEAGHEAALEFIHPSVRDFLLSRYVKRPNGKDLNVSELKEPPPELARFLGEYVDEGELNDAQLNEICSWSSDPMLWQTKVALGALQAPRREAETAEARRGALNRLAGLRFDRLDFTGVELSRIILRNASFRGTNLRSGRFVDCDLSDADLSSAHLEETEFLACQLTNAKIDDLVAVSGYVSDDPDRGSVLRGAELKAALREAIRSEPNDWIPAKDTEAARLGELVGRTLRVFVPKGRAPKRSVLQESLLRNKDIRGVVQAEVLPILMREDTDVIFRGRPQASNASLVVRDIGQVKGWLERPDAEDPVLRTVLAALLRRDATAAESRDFAGGIHAQ